MLRKKRILIESTSISLKNWKKLENISVWCIEITKSYLKHINFEKKSYIFKCIFPLIIKKNYFLP